jgi:hypothetical protein
VVKIPEVIYIGPHDYEVRAKKRLDTLGETLNNDTTILYRRSQSSSNLRDTILHEIMHAIVFQSGAAVAQKLSHQDEENLIVTLTPWILQVFQDNPALVEFLVENREREH